MKYLQFRFQWKVNKSLSLKSDSLCCQKTLAISSRHHSSFQGCQGRITPVVNHFVPGRKPCVSLLAPWNLTLSPTSAVSLPQWHLHTFQEHPGDAQNAQDTAGCISPARQGAAETPGLVSTDLTLYLRAIEQWRGTRLLRASLGISNIVQHGALQVLLSENIQTVVVNR